MFTYFYSPHDCHLDDEPEPGYRELILERWTSMSQAFHDTCSTTISTAKQAHMLGSQLYAYLKLRMVGYSANCKQRALMREVIGIIKYDIDEMEKPQDIFVKEKMAICQERSVLEKRGITATERLRVCTSREDLCWSDNACVVQGLYRSCVPAMELKEIQQQEEKLSTRLTELHAAEHPILLALAKARSSLREYLSELEKLQEPAYAGDCSLLELSPEIKNVFAQRERNACIIEQRILEMNTGGENCGANNLNEEARKEFMSL